MQFGCTGTLLLTAGMFGAHLIAQGTPCATISRVSRSVCACFVKTYPQRPWSRDLGSVAQIRHSTSPYRVASTQRRQFSSGDSRPGLTYCQVCFFEAPTLIQQSAVRAPNLYVGAPNSSGVLMGGLHRHCVHPEAPSEHPPVTRMPAASGLRLLVCSRCGAVHSMDEAGNVGPRILSRLGQAGLGPGAPPVLSPDWGAR